MAKINERDLRVLQKRAPLYTFVGSEDGKTYKGIKLFLTINDSLLMQDEQKKTKEEMNKDRRQVVSNMCRRKYDHMTPEWLEENMSFNIFSQICSDIIEYSNTTLDNISEMDMLKKNKTKKAAMKIMKKLKLIS